MSFKETVLIICVVTLSVLDKLSLPYTEQGYLTGDKVLYHTAIDIYAVSYRTS